MKKNTQKNCLMLSSFRSKFEHETLNNAFKIKGYRNLSVVHCLDQFFSLFFVRFNITFIEYTRD